MKNRSEIHSAIRDKCILFWLQIGGKIILQDYCRHIITLNSVSDFQILLLVFVFIIWLWFINRILIEKKLLIDLMNETII